MTSATNSANAATRRATALSKLDVLDTAPEADFDQLVQLAQTLCQTPIVTIGLLDAHREWFRASIGIEATELPIEESFAARVIAGPQILVVPDATKNSRFASLPLVSAPNGVRFLAAAPLLTRDGTAIGALTVMDRLPRLHFSVEQRTALQTVAAQIVAQLTLRQVVRDLALTLCRKYAAKAEAKQLRLLLPLCSECKNVRMDDDYWQAVDEYLSSHTHPTHTHPYHTHGICTECREESSSPVSPRPQPYPKLLGSRLGPMSN